MFSTIREALVAIGKPVPADVISEKRLKGTAISYVSWSDAVALMDLRCPEWEYEIREVQSVKDQVVLVARVTVHTLEGKISREATGNESDQVSGYGDPFSNAESMAIRRALAKFGLGRELYRGKVAEATATAEAETRERVEALLQWNTSKIEPLTKAQWDAYPPAEREWVEVWAEGLTVAAVGGPEAVVGYWGANHIGGAAKPVKAALHALAMDALGQPFFHPHLKAGKMIKEGV